MLLLCMAAVQTSNAAPVSDTQFEQYQAARRQAEQQQAQIQAPSVQLQETRNENGALLLPKNIRISGSMNLSLTRGKAAALTGCRKNWNHIRISS